MYAIRIFYENDSYLSVLIYNQEEFASSTYVHIVMQKEHLVLSFLISLSFW